MWILSSAYCYNITHVIKGATNFLCRLKDLGDIPENAIICTIDVVGPYPDIPHAEEHECTKEIISDLQSKLDYNEK